MRDAIASGDWGRFKIVCIGGNHTVFSNRMAWTTITDLKEECAAFVEGYHLKLLNFTGRVFTYMQPADAKAVS